MYLKDTYFTLTNDSINKVPDLSDNAYKKDSLHSL